MSTSKKIIAMLKENTGKHFLDSGGNNNRGWQKNQVRTFKNEKSCNLEISTYNDTLEVDITFNIYHYLNAFLELNLATRYLNTRFKKFCNLDNDASYLALMEGFCKENLKVEFNTINTYNYDNLLSQVIQYVHFNWDNKEFIILQVHNGCDVRGGYTVPCVFEITNLDYFRLAQTDASLCCVGSKIAETGGIDFKTSELTPVKKQRLACKNNWSSDDTYHWYYQGCSSDEKPLKNYVYAKDGKLYCKDCQGEILASVMDSV
ncbi:hypothetical protein LCGC14_2229330 [marine sediment metagenome]|uniref:Uncharacterized protein n=1 Tax=marine sediment metagenome TaxID=412755 RepID=A0A0F9FL97_9ZZZZ